MNTCVSVALKPMVRYKDFKKKPESDNETIDLWQLMLSYLNRPTTVQKWSANQLMPNNDEIEYEWIRATIHRPLDPHWSWTKSGFFVLFPLHWNLNTTNRKRMGYKSLLCCHPTKKKPHQNRSRWSNFSKPVSFQIYFGNMTESLDYRTKLNGKIQNCIQSLLYIISILKQISFKKKLIYIC